MGRRVGTLVSKCERAASRPSPNATVEQVTVEIRAYWPPGMDHGHRVRALLTEAYDQAMLETYAQDAEDLWVRGPWRLETPREGRD